MEVWKKIASKLLIVAVLRAGPRYAGDKFGRRPLPNCLLLQYRGRARDMLKIRQWLKYIISGFGMP